MEEIEKVYKEIDNIKLKGTLLFSNYDSDYYKFEEKYYCIANQTNLEKADYWCEELTLQELELKRKYYIEELEGFIECDRIDIEKLKLL